MIYDTIKKLIFFLFCLSVSHQVLALSPLSRDKIEWSNSLCLPAVDNEPNIGVAGAFSGFIGNTLVIAGGANFPEAMPWEGGTKEWWNTIYYIDAKDSSATWEIAEEVLPDSRAYGLSVELPGGLLCIGGCDSIQCYKDVFLIRKKNRQIELSLSWPALPVPLANATGALLNNCIYVAGGQVSMKEQAATGHFYKLDLSDLKKGWQELATWPGEPRGYAVSAVQSDGFDKCFYLFSGRNYQTDGTVKVLTDGFVYNPRMKSWKKLDRQFPVMAGTALPTGINHILLFGGVPQLIPGSADHPGFDNRVRLYHTITNTLVEREISPYILPVTTSIAKKDNAFYITSGEVKPGIRTPEIVQGEIIPFEKKLGFLNIAVIGIYFALLAWIGYYFSKRQKNTEDYFKGGGRLPWWAVGLSIFGTSLSAITFMSIPAKAYASDWSYMLVNVGILMVVPVILYLFIPFYRKLNVTTAYEYLELRFNSLIRVICSLAFILFQVGRMGIVMYLPAIALNVITGFNIFLCIGLMGVLSLIYTMIGGIEAVVWTDALQVVILLGGAILVVIVAVFNIPEGFSGIVREAAVDNKFSLGSFDFNLKQSTLWTVLIATFFTNLTTYGTDQTMVQRYMTTGTEKQARKSVLTNAVLTIPATLLFFFVGTVLYVYYKHNPLELSITVSDGDAILPWYIYSELPQGVVGLLVSGILAAAMSTLSSSMNSAATAYVTDIHSKINHHKVDLKVAKIATMLLGAAGIFFAYLMATWDINSLWDEFNKILGIILGSLGGLFLLGMITRRANATGALCGIIGSIMVQLTMIHF
ncbi:sodium:solute symporter family transporter [Parabacteroides goldsteinii]|uniref:Solute:sodium symporter (SSS) family transporter n=1 Tax=Parabacteroides goldsteinii DSM 19448 = WAL 12034 TaxID=927665 RepID=A0A0F5JQ17_9BACT|nr:sodium/solute symporter [Parabacteroides goldsteinii]KKB59804.1 solute:sodium symporter (SSS) family transporter [Parabacteroides goldsteinii DSM 19448 = WAL 12034]